MAGKSRPADAPPKTILFLSPCFDDGGGERAWVNLLNNLDRDEFHAVAMWFYAKQTHFLDLLPPDLKIYDLHHQSRFRYDIPRLVWETAKVLRRERPYAVLSFLNEWNIILFAARILAGSRAKVFACEHGSVGASLPVRNIPGWQKKMVTFLYRRVYRHSRRYIPCSEGVAHDLIDNFDARPDRVTVIYNPLDTASVRSMGEEPVDHPWFHEDKPIIISVGRLIEHKDYPTLVRAFAKVREQTDVRLALVGEGHERGRIEAAVLEVGVADETVLLGAQSNPFKYVSRASVFALSSVSEGFSYAIVEALALGIPVVSTDCPSGPAEVLEGGRSGVLVPPGDPDALAAAILSALEDRALRATLSAEGRRRAEDFGIETIVDRYERCILS